VKKEYRNMENKLQSASIIEEDEGIVGIIEEVFCGARYNNLRSLRKKQVMKTG
jgi:hypothetical protein